MLKLREKRQKEPEKRHYISQGRVCSADLEHPSVDAQPCNSPPTSSNSRENLESIMRTRFQQLEETFSRSLDRFDASISKTTGMTK